MACLNNQKFRRLLHLHIHVHVRTRTTLPLLLECPLLVQFRVKRERLHEQRREETDAGNANGDLPDDLEAAPERLAHLRLERFVERADDGDRGVRDGNAP